MGVEVPQARPSVAQTVRQLGGGVVLEMGTDLHRRLSRGRFGWLLRLPLASARPASRPDAVHQHRVILTIRPSRQATRAYGGTRTTEGAERRAYVTGVRQAGCVPVQSELYRDRWITCTDTDVIVRGYYFPLGTPKVIPYADIRSVAAVNMGALTGKGRLWGTSSPRYWAHLDVGRPWKRTALVLDVGGRVMPFITPSDPERVREIIEERRRSRA